MSGVHRSASNALMPGLPGAAGRCRALPGAARMSPGSPFSSLDYRIGPPGPWQAISRPTASKAMAATKARIILRFNLSMR